MTTRRLNRISSIRALTGFGLAISLMAGSLSAQAQTETFSAILNVRVLDEATEQPLEGVSVGFDLYATGTTDANGFCRLEGLPGGTFTVTFFKAEYLPGTVTGLELAIGEEKDLFFPLRLRADDDAAGSDIFDMEGIVISATVLQDSDFALRAMRFESTLALDTLSSADLSRFAASDVGEALIKIPGVSVQSGRFAVIRGLDERYASTLLNGAPVPSPDPEKQSVPLDLFPSEIVGSLIVAKSFAPDQPGNSVGGSIGIVTAVYPEFFEAGLSYSTGFNDNAQDAFVSDAGRERVSVDFKNLNSIENRQTASAYKLNGRLTPLTENAPLDQKITLKLGDTREIFGRKIRYFVTGAKEESYKTQIGFEEKRAALNGVAFFGFILQEGDFAYRRMSLTKGRYDLTESQAEDRETLLATAQIDLDREGNHKIGYNFFINKMEIDLASVRENGSFKNVDFDGDGRDRDDIIELGGWPQVLIQRGITGQSVEGFDKLGFFRTRLSNEERELKVHQVKGEHALPGLSESFKLSWTASSAETNQEEFSAVSAAGLRLADGTFIAGTFTDVSSLDLKETFVPLNSWRLIEEAQEFGRIDLENTFHLRDNFSLKAKVGAYSEDTERDVYQEFFILDRDMFNLENILLQSNPTGFETMEEAVSFAYASPNQASQSGNLAESTREVQAAYLSAGFELSQKLELTLGVRMEKLEMQTSSSAEGNFFNYELLRDTSRVGGATPSNAIRNAYILGLDGPLDADFTGVIDEDYALPALSLTYRPNDNWRILLAYSETVARPSFREFTYVTTIDPNTLEYVSGNPTLRVSDVESADARIEYLFDEGADLIAVSLFRKNVENPIEKTVLYGFLETEIFFNNPNPASIEGIEFEVRKSLRNLENSFLQYFSFGGNLSLIKAEVKVPERMLNLIYGTTPIIDGVATPDGNFYVSIDPDNNLQPATTRPLFAQPEWIANVDATFDHPRWGSRLTVSLFAQSRVLYTAAGTTGASGTAVPDRYIDSYESVNITFSQRLTNTFRLGFSVKNVTDPTRRIIYDDAVVDALPEKAYKAGRAYSVSITASF